ncbi:cilia- and flagella-associated protein 157 isoform X2 [Rhineura floridana]|uniref:cilia- and flagella-associated protein 157 isoform X2 n=1 Tax=Rhineura floridana TaxID=261503 RepID=UPI002AC80127|nr:cilia- and flagella-associated protein 157 isoform X2 [Rhineura floridana]
MPHHWPVKVDPLGYQKKWDELQVSEELFRAEYEKMVGDNKEIVAFLKKTLNQRVDEIADLTEQLQNLQQAKDTEKDAFEAQLGQLRHEFQETKDQLTSENMVLSGKLAALEEFRIQKDEIMYKFSELEGQLMKQEEDHKEFIYNLEKKAVIDKERLKKEMMHRVNMVAAEFRKVAHSQMAETTKRTIRENVAISFQLTKITEQSFQLVQENDRLKEVHSQTLKQLQLLEENEKKMAKNSLSNQKMIWMLTSKCKELQVQVDEYTEMKKVMAQIQDTNEMLEQQNLLLKEELDVQNEELQRKVTEDQHRAKTREEEHQRRLNAERILRHTAQALKEVLLERPLDEDEDGHFDVMFHLRRNDALQGTLNLLNRSIARIEANQILQAVTVDTKVGKPTNMEGSLSTDVHLMASRFMSHIDVKMLGPHPVHSMPSLSKISRTRVDTLRPYASATEPLIAAWKTEVKEEEVKPEEEEVPPEERSLPAAAAQLDA